MTPKSTSGSNGLNRKTISATRLSYWAPARLDEALASCREGLDRHPQHPRARTVARNMMRDANGRMVAAPFHDSDQYRRPYSGFRSLAIVHRKMLRDHSCRCTDGSALPALDRVLSGVFTQSVAFCGGESDEILERDLSMFGLHGRCLKGSDSREHTAPVVQNIPIAIDRNEL
jgi:hypothetical protein